MSTPARLGLFVAGLAVVFGGSFALGAATDDDDAPVDPPSEHPADDHTSD